MSPDLTRARQLAAEDRWPEAIALLRSLDEADPREPEASRELSRCLFAWGEARFLEAGDLVTGAPALFEAVVREAEEWAERGAERRLRRRVDEALERTGGLRRWLREPGPAPAALGYWVSRFAAWPGQFSPEGPESRSLRIEARVARAPDDPWGLIARAALRALAGQRDATLEDLREASRAVDRSGRRIDFDLRDALRFFELLPNDERSWSDLSLPDANRWQRAGCTAWEAERWAAAVGDLEASMAWWRRGVAPVTATPWHVLGFDPESAVRWRRRETSPEAAARWRDGGFGPEEASQWARRGATPAEGAAWREAGFEAPDFDRLTRNLWKRLSLGEAVAWRRKGVSVDGILERLQRGVVAPSDAEHPPAPISPAEESEWRAHGFDLAGRVLWSRSGATPASARAYRDRGFDAEAAGAWIDRGFDPADARSWTARGATASEAAALREDGVPPTLHAVFRDATVRSAWKATTIPWESAARFLRRGFSCEVAAAWHRAGVDDTSARILTRAGLDPKDAVPWKEAGIGDSEILGWRTAGFDPRGARSWSELGFRSGEARLWRDAEIEPEEAARWADAGIPAIRGRSWAIVGLRVDDVPAMREAGWSQPIVDRLATLGRTDLSAWIGAGFGPTADVAAWRRAGWEPEEAFRWWRRFSSPSTAARHRRQGVEPEALLCVDRGRDGWHTGLPAALQEVPEPGALVERFVNEGFRERFEGLEEATPWLRAGVFEDGIVAAGWRTQGFAASEAAAWIARGVTRPKFALEARAEGRSPRGGPSEPL